MKNVFYGIVILLAGMVISCAKDSKNAVLQVRLTDAPAAYDQVLIDIQDVQIHVSDNESNGNWQSLDISKGVYNLLDFRNGMDTLLGSIELPAGKISQMRVVLGTNNKIIVDGVEHSLETPSAQQSGLKFNIHAQLSEGIIYRLWIDFDASRSIVDKGNGAYSLKPVIRPFTEATSGAIKGIVNPIEATPKIIAIANGDTVGAIPGPEGKFLFRGLAAGAYKVEFEATENYSAKTVDNVSVSVGEVTDMGIVNLAN